MHYNILPFGAFALPIGWIRTFLRLRAAIRGDEGGGQKIKISERGGCKNVTPRPQGDGESKGESNRPTGHLEKPKNTRKCVKWGPILLQGGAPTQSRGLTALDPKQTPHPPLQPPKWVSGLPP